ncbi:acyltransferase family protein [Mangrovicoccus algicola]|uniref:Acyltransferase n=1 Tax=Mangrovicoccus algicola TaxID=2771008 RepID=A0A8J7CZ81_9RHOB|nr:acyltransferase family protein [Mangrovicoccus algicola]MBE3640527.1 acyltransferase [Mangrovicoccus algicola]
MTYRSDIDGLRAIAVLLVLLFHCQFPGFAGGYVGVDVFFVISGYLITGIMLEDLRRERFSFKTFYIRRARRLLPALAATILLTLIGAGLIMTPEHLKETATSAIWTALSLANLHFAMADSYFGAASEIKPLLHTWSLSVEEQFYLGWPVALVLCYRIGGRRAVLAAVVLGALAGLALSEYWIDRNPKQAYFLPMFRAYQFLAGAALVFAGHLRLPPRAEEAGLAAGLVLVIGSALAYDETTPFPGLMGLVPTVGAVLLLQCGRARMLGRGLVWRPAVWLGHVSYSAYLAHWPVIVFWRYLSADPFSFAEKVILLALSIGIGALLYHFVETPFRLHRAAAARMRWSQMAPPLGALAVLALAAFGLRAADGLPQRMGLAPAHEDYARLSRFQFLDDYGDGVLQLGRGTSGERILIFGDSMMQNYVPALMRLPRFAEAEVTVISRGGCVMAAGAVRVINHTPDRDCSAYRDRVAAQEGPFDLAVWGQNWTSYGDSLNWEAPGQAPRPAFPDQEPDMAGWQDGVTATLDRLQEVAEGVILFGPQYNAAGVPPLLERIGPFAPLEAAAEGVARIRHAEAPARAEILAGLRAMEAGRTGLRVIDPQALLCDGAECRFHEGGVSYFMDPVHHTAAATPMLAARLEALLR